MLGEQVGYPDLQIRIEGRGNLLIKRVGKEDGLGVGVKREGPAGSFLTFKPIYPI